MCLSLCTVWWGSSPVQWTSSSYQSPPPTTHQPTPALCKSCGCCVKDVELSVNHSISRSPSLPSSSSSPRVPNLVFSLLAYLLLCLGPECLPRHWTCLRSPTPPSRGPTVEGAGGTSILTTSLADLKSSKRGSEHALYLYIFNPTLTYVMSIVNVYVLLLMMLTFH